MGAAPPGVRNLFRAALVIFVITIVIGILNGTDVWEPPRNTLLTHVHAGTLGWITLAVFGAAIWMFGSPNDSGTSRLANFSIAALPLYVLAFWSVDWVDTSIQRPIAGTLAFLAMVWMLVWVLRRKRMADWDVAELGMGLAVTFLVIGAVLGVLLGLQLADVEIVDPATAGQLSEAHPGAMVAGFVLLAGLALIEWLMPGRRVPTMAESKSGVVEMMLLFIAGLLFVAGALFEVEPLLQAAGGLQLLGAVVLIVRFRGELAPGRWSGPVEGIFVRTAVVGLVIAVGMIVYLISQLSSGTEIDELLPVLLTFDHVNFIMVMTNLIFAMLILTTQVTEASNRAIFWAVNVGVVGFAIGLITESAVLKRIFTPILGVGLLYAIYSYLTAPDAPAREAAAV